MGFDEGTLSQFSRRLGKQRLCMSPWIFCGARNDEKLHFLFPSSYVAAVSEYMKTRYKCLPTQPRKENSFCQVKVRSSDFVCKKSSQEKLQHTYWFCRCRRNDNSRKSSFEVGTQDLNRILISIKSLFMTFVAVRRFRWLQEVISMRLPFKVLLFWMKIVFLLKRSVSSILHGRRGVTFQTNFRFHTHFYFRQTSLHNASQTITSMHNVQARNVTN